MTPPALTVTVLGPPKPQGSMRAFNAGGKAVITHSTTTAGYRNQVADATARAVAESAWTAPDAAVVTILFVMPRPKSDPKWRRERWQWANRRPDLDKLVRLALDGFVAGGALADDAAVVELAASKVYADPSEQPRMSVTIHGINEADVR